MPTESRRGGRHRGGFTLVELLVVIAIIGTLVGLLLPAVQVARESARRSACSNNLKQLALGCLNFADARTALPASHTASWAPSHVDYANNPANAINGAVTWSYIARVLPYIEQKAYYDSAMTYYTTYMPANIGTAGNWNNAPTTARRIPGIECPSDRMTQFRARFFAPTSYRACAGDNICSASGWVGSTAANTRGRTANGLSKLSKVTDGLSKTIMLGEAVIGDYTDDSKVSFAVAGASYNNVQRPSMCVAATPSMQSWTDAGRYVGGKWADSAVGNTWFFAIQQPNTQRCSYTDTTVGYGNQYVTMPTSSYHSGGAQVAMCDGAVRFMSDQIDNNNLPDYASGQPSATEGSRYGVLGALGTPAQAESFQWNGVD